MNLFRKQRPEPVSMSRRRSRGQVIVIFAGAMLAFMGLMAIVIDVSWYWANTLRVQRAADSAALAGVVWLPSLFSSADTTARNEAEKNGYKQGVNGATITTAKDINNDRKLIVTISAPVPSFFARVIGIQSFQVTRTSKAEFILPVAMGSPENYYGVFGQVRDATFTGTTPGSTNFDPPTGVVAGGPWTTPLNADALVDDNLYAVTPAASGNATRQQWQNFNFTTGAGAIPATAVIDGIQVSLGGSVLTGSGGSTTNCNFGTEVTWNGSVGVPTWSTLLNSAPLTTVKGVPPSNIVGSASNLGVWGGHGWVQGDFTNTNFRVRLTWNQTACSGARTGSLDSLTVNVSYHVTTTTTTNNNLQGPGTGCANGVSDCFNPNGAVLTPRGFWGTMNTEGAANVNGDAFQPYYDAPTSNVSPPCPTATIRACYDNLNYYNYAIDMPAGSTNGFVYVFDPEFCATALNSGTADRFFDTSTQNGHIPNYNPISSWYELYNTNNLPYKLSAHTLLTTTGTKFTNSTGYDTTMNGGNTTLPTGTTECKQVNTAYGDGRDYHDSWVLLNPGAPLTGGATGTLYRLHTTGTDPASGSAQRNANGEQSFSIFASASGGTPDVYGLGAMQMFTPLELPAPQPFSEFYIAQVPQAHAGKTLELSLWDPGDTGALSANIQIEIPTAGGWTPVSMQWTAVAGTSASPQPCGSYAPGTGFSIVTNAGGGSTGVYNGCWLTIDVTIPSAYLAPQGGWWKIRYNMAGTGTSSDVTTWTAKIRGNPVHLVLQ